MARKVAQYVLVVCAVFCLVMLVSLGSSRYGSNSKWNFDVSTPSFSYTDNSTDTEAPNHRSASYDRNPKDTTSELGRASNATLGFQKAYVLSLPERSDKRDGFALAASLTGFHVEFFDGVRGEDVQEKAKPPTMGDSLHIGALGCWRGHMNIIRSVIDHDLASVFIFEDDADWDIRFLSQLAELAKGVRHLSGISFTERQHSPYGDDWDIIWPGHCGERPPETDDDRKYIIENDETVAPKDKQSGIKLLKTYPEGTRIVHKTVAPICAFGYAISYRGAQKILAELAVKGTVWPIDNGLAFLCHDEALDLKCFTVVPQLVQHHRPAGPKDKDSDIESYDGSTVRKKGSTETIVLSARLNIEQLIRGTEDWVKQW